MPRRKVTFEYDPSNREGKPLERIIAGWSGVDALNIVIEDLPDPPIVQRFVMVVESDPEMGPFDPSAWARDLKLGQEYMPLSFRNGRRRILSLVEEDQDHE